MTLQARQQLLEAHFARNLVHVWLPIEKFGVTHLTFLAKSTLAITV